VGAVEVLNGHNDCFLVPIHWGLIATSTVAIHPDLRKNSDDFCRCHVTKISDVTDWHTLLASASRKVSSWMYEQLCSLYCYVVETCLRCHIRFLVSAHGKNSSNHTRDQTSSENTDSTYPVWAVIHQWLKHQHGAAKLLIRKIVVRTSCEQKGKLLLIWLQQLTNYLAEFAFIVWGIVKLQFP